MIVSVTGPRGTARAAPGSGRARIRLRRRRRQAVLRLVEVRLRRNAGLPCAPPPEEHAAPRMLPAWAPGALTEVRDGAAGRKLPDG